MKRTLAWLIMGATLFANAWAVFPTSTFDHDAQGWRVAPGGDYTSPVPGNEGPICDWDGRGNPGGALSIGDVYYQTYVAAPAGYLGDHRDMLGKALWYDIAIRYSDYVNYAPVGLVGAGLSLIYDAPFPQLGVYERRTVLFEANRWRLDSTTGPFATPAQLEAVLADVRGLYFGTEWHSGGDDTSFDNVTAGAVSAAQLTLRFTLQDYVGDVTAKTATVEVLDAASGQLAASKTQYLAPHAEFQIGIPALGHYRVRAQVGGFLAKQTGDTAIMSDTTLEMSVINGDVDGDNAVTVYDYNALSDAFDSAEGDANWNADADLDGDGGVTVYDYNILSQSFDLAGD